MLPKPSSVCFPVTFRSVFFALLFYAIFMGTLSYAQYASEWSDASRFSGPNGNPAWFGEETQGALSLETSLPGGENRYFGAGIHNNGLGAWYEWSHSADGQDLSQVHFFSASRVGSRSYLGFQATYFRPDPGMAHWLGDLGFGSRPFSWLSLGYHSDNLWVEQRELFPLTHNLGASIRLPFTDFIFMNWNGRFGRYSNKNLPIREQRLGMELNAAGWQAGISFPIEDQSLKSPLVRVALQAGPGGSIFYSAPTQGKQSSTMGLDFDFSYHTNSAWGNRVVYIDLSVPIEERSQNLSLFSEEHRSLHDVLNQLQIIAADPKIKGVVLDLGGVQGDWAVAGEIRKAIADLHRSGKFSVAWLENVSMYNYYLASACKRVVMHPTGSANLHGFSRQTLLYKGFLEKIGVKAHFVRHGKYKSAVEPFTRDSLSPEARENMENMLETAIQIFIDSVSVARNILPLKLDSMLESLTAVPDSLQAAGLIDGIMYLDEIPEWIEHPGLLEWDWQDNGIYEKAWKPRARIAVVYLQGTIIPGSGGRENLMGSEFIGSDDVKTMFRNLGEDPFLRGVVLRINSPGGSAQASDEIAHAVKRLKESGVPVVVSVGGMAASGGYYFAAPANEIWVDPMSVVGSIGIFGGKADISGLLQKLEINAETIKTHIAADWNSMTRGYTEQEEAAIQENMDLFYDRFVRLVAQHRELSYEQVDSLAQGQIWTGRDAVDNGLADGTGGLHHAIQRAAILAGFSPADHQLEASFQNASGFDLMPLVGSSRNIEYSRLIEIFGTTQTWALSFPASGF